VAQSHNDYLQVLADGGIVAGVIALGFLVLLFRAMFRAVQSRDPLLAGLALGSSAGIFGILVHSLFDFNLQLPSNALLFLLLCVVVSLISREVDKSQRQAKGVIESGTLAGVLSK
jgi:O-antigen ligase